MTDKETFDFWYAVNNTEIIVRPRQQLETFGTTTIYYHLVAETMDAVNQIRVREGRIHAFRPQIITPDSLTNTMLEGFGEEQAEQYLDWLKNHEANLVLLKYGFSVRKESISDQIITDSIENVLDRVKKDVENKSDPMQSLIRGVDEPWEVCLLTLLVDIVQQSAIANASDLQQDPDGMHHRIDTLFREASRDSSRISELSDLLTKSNKFKQYEDRFFALVKASH